MSVVVLYVTTKCQCVSIDAAAPIPGVINATATSLLKDRFEGDSLALLH